MTQIQIRPNTPQYLTLADPAGDAAQGFDFEMRIGSYRTTDGRALVLPESGCIAVNQLSPRPGEEIQITRVWSGKSHDPEHWVVCLSKRSEQARAAAGEPDPLTEALERQLTPALDRRLSQEPPRPIRAPEKRPPGTEQPVLFELGTGTHGPAPRLRPVAVNRTPPEQIPANVAVKEILEFLNADPNTKNWGDQAQQGLLSTILIAEYKAKRIGLWERKP